MALINKKEEFLKNPLIILQSEAVFLALRKLWVNNHANVKRPDEFVRDFFEFLRKTDLPPSEIRKYYEAKLKENRSAETDASFKQDMFLQLIKKDLDRLETILDFGCGKLTFLKNIADQNKNIKNLIGVDSQSRPVLRNLDPRIKFKRNLDKIAGSSVDLAFIKLVLHHIESDGEILKILENIKKILKSGGKLIIFEESFPEGEYDIGKTKEYLNKFGLELAGEATADFLKLAAEEKKQFLFLNDWLINLQNAYMPWTGQYKSMEEWTKLAQSAGFKNAENNFIGAIKKRKRKQGMTAIIKMNN